MDDKDFELAINELILELADSQKRYLTSQYYFESAFWRCNKIKHLLFNSPRYKTTRQYDVVYSVSKDLRKWMLQNHSEEIKWCVGNKGPFSRTVMLSADIDNKKLKNYLLNILQNAYKITRLQPELSGKDS